MANASTGPNVVLVIPTIAVLIVVAALSFWPAAPGHPATLFFAAPPIGLGLLLFLSAAMGRAPFPVLLLSMSPAMLGILSIGLWYECRGRSR